ncbi:Cyclic di-GMP phosphodiesterase Gmr [Clostridioides difficile]|nr:c-di-GMP diguanylate cyclase DccA [Clostridioides difficile]MDU3064482.1 c-di-GMP diguanylate cyclase DccA [Clostridioides difficile]CZR72900.1 signaling protein [Clostridium difficile BI1] [Clostridioides difficile]CZR84637.1 Cyclic di-GMP phosphodiesterase Gmr [Clostridioides difficile]CZS04540.1 Cyclic di-GMP phosphodiesterase Gmr [Clostridioides difficile]HBF6216254.1 GGDEF domain-containing protein [Clostridioides difficile]
MFKEIFLRTFPGFLIIRDSNYRIIFINDNLKNLIKSYMQDNPLGMTNIEIAKKLPDNIAKFFMDSHNIQLDWEKNYPYDKISNWIFEFKKDTTSYWNVLEYKVDVDEKTYIITMANDITKLYEENKRNLHYSITDPLTGAYNRKYLNDRFDIFIGDYIVLIDLDNFKMINDYEGHNVGDKILCDFVSLLNKELINSTSIIRLGGDEFIVIFSSDVDKNYVYSQLEALRENFLKVFSKYKYLSFSYGVDTVKRNLKLTIVELDKKMYKNKEKNKKKFDKNDY